MKCDVEGCEFKAVKNPYGAPVCNFHVAVLAVNKGRTSLDNKHVEIGKEYIEKHRMLMER